MSRYGGAAVFTSAVAAVAPVRGFALREITVADSPYTVQASDYEIHANTAGGAITINLPTVASSRRRRLVMKNTGTSGNSVTVDPAGLDTIDAAAVLILPDNASSGLTSPLTGTNWATT